MISIKLRFNIIIIILAKLDEFFKYVYLIYYVLYYNYLIYMSINSLIIMKVTIYHNPRCGTSRNTLALIREAGEEPEIIEYLKNTPTKEELITIIKDSNISVRDAIRNKEPIYKTLNLDDSKWSDDELIDFMLENPILINRPFVITEKGTRFCRPAETVNEIL